MAPRVGQGTRVVVIKDGVRRPGTVTEVRLETYLRPFVVKCDDGGEVFASSYHLALEDDPLATPLGEPVERD